MSTTNGLNKPVFFTNHALKQAQARCGLSEKEAYTAISQAKEFDLSKGEWAHKLNTYGMQMVETHFFYNPKGFVFTVVEKDNCYLVITTVKKQYDKINYSEDYIDLTHAKI